MLSLANSSNVIKSKAKPEYKLEFRKENIVKTKHEFNKRLLPLYELLRMISTKKPISGGPKSNIRTTEELKDTTGKEICHRKETLVKKVQRRKTEAEFHVPFAPKECFVCICKASSHNYREKSELKSFIQKPWINLQKSKTEPRLFKYHLVNVPATVQEDESKNNNNSVSEIPGARRPNQRLGKQIKRRNTEPLFNVSMPRLITSKLVRSKSFPGKDNKKMVVVEKVIYYEEEETVIVDGFLTTDLCSTEL